MTEGLCPIEINGRESEYRSVRNKTKVRQAIKRVDRN